MADDRNWEWQLCVNCSKDIPHVYWIEMNVNGGKRGQNSCSVRESRPFLLVIKVCSKSFQCIFSKWPFSDLSISLAFFCYSISTVWFFIVYVCGATNILSSCIQIIDEECASLPHLQILDASRYLCLKNSPVFGCLTIYLCLMNIWMPGSSA